MSYGIRNSLILLVVLALFVAGGWGYISYFQQPEIDRLESEIEDKSSELQEKQQIADQYETVLNQYENARFYVNNFEKTLFPTSNTDRVFDFLNNLNQGSAYTDFSFSFSDSTAQGEFGIITMDISGSGYYRFLNNFIRQIEYSQPLSKIIELEVNPINELESYGRVNFDFSLQSYYDRQRLTESDSFEMASASMASLYNPFYPLIRDIPPNEEDLANIEQSDIVALSSNKVFILNQSGSLQRLQVGDRVYLGSLQSIDIEERTATFELNKGGIIELVTLEVEQ